MFSRFCFPKSCSAIAIVSLFVLSATQASWAQSEDVARARSENYPLSVRLPENWESFQGDPKVSGETLFLQSPEGDPMQATINWTAFPMTGTWDDLLRRERFHLVVEKNAPILVNEALTLRGARGHKWVYEGTAANGELKVYYRMYLLLPATVGPRRLLVAYGVANQAQSDSAVKLFNDLVRTANWSQP